MLTAAWPPDSWRGGTEREGREAIVGAVTVTLSGVPSSPTGAAPLVAGTSRADTTSPGRRPPAALPRGV